MKGRVLLFLSSLQLLSSVKTSFCSLDQTSADCGQKIVDLRWDIEIAKSTGKATISYSKDYLKHLSQVQVAKKRLSDSLSIPSNESKLLDKIRLELIDKVKVIETAVKKSLDKTVPSYQKELVAFTKDWTGLRSKLRHENCDQKSLLKPFQSLWKRISVLKVNVLGLEKALLGLKYDVLNLEFADSIEKYSLEYKKFLKAKRDKAMKKAAVVKLKNDATHKKSPTHVKHQSTDHNKVDHNVVATKANATSFVSAPSPAFKKHKVAAIDWGMKLTRELDQELKKTSNELAQMSDKLTKELADLERIGIELFGAQKAFVA